MPNATVRANARTLPKSPPHSAESIRRQTAELNTAVAELREAGDDRRAAAERQRLALKDLETPIRELHDLTVIVIEWADGQNFYHPNAAADDNTNREHSRQVDRLMFGLEQIEERVSDLRTKFNDACDQWRTA